MAWNSRAAILKTTKPYRDRVHAARDGDVTISDQQKASLKQFPVKGPMWVSKFQHDPPDDSSIRSRLFQAIDSANDGYGGYDRVNAGKIEGEWTGYRPNVGPKEPEPPSLSEAEKFACLTKDSSSPTTIMYMYGGAFYMNTPSTYRKTCSRLAHLSKARCYCIRQRLSPQNPFPAALLDLLLGYMALLSPPPGAMHEPVPPSSIIFAGDSSGSSLCLALVQLILTMQRLGLASDIDFYGKPVELMLPAGVACISGVAEYSNSLPSHAANEEFDVFTELPPYMATNMAACELWPSKPPRAHVYCETRMLLHPMICPATSSTWAGSPPLWFSSGQEQIIDSIKFLGQMARKQGVTVILKEYEALPHVFPLYFGDAPQAKKVWAEWAAVCNSMVAGEKLESKTVFVRAKDLSEQPIQRDDVNDLSLPELRSTIDKALKRFTIFTGQDASNAASKL